MGIIQIFVLPNEKKTCVIRLTMGVIGGIFMHRIVFGTALLFSCLGVTFASAESPRDKHSTADFGVGGWTVDVKVDSHRQTVSSASAGGVSSATAQASSKAFTHAFAGGVSSSSTIEVSSASAGAVSSGATNLPDLRHLPREVLLNDSDCVFVAQNTPTGNRWRPGCK